MTPSPAHALARPLSPMPAPAPALPAGASLVLLRPPYSPAELLPAPARLWGVGDVPGTVLGLRLSQTVLDAHSLPALLRDLARRVPACPVVVLLDLPAEEALPLAAALAPLRPRAVVPPLGASTATLLRSALSDPASLAGGVVEWLQLRGIRLNPNQAYLLERILARAPEHLGLGRLLEALDVPQSSARFRLRKRRLPPPGQWFQLARALHAALLLQAEPERTAESIAARLGFADHSALAHLLRRTFGTHAREVRRTLGWEWLLSRWWTARL